MWNLDNIYEVHPTQDFKNTCKFKSLPADQWLTKPGQQQATSRLDHEAKKLQDLNKAGHDFEWNGLPGRDESNPSTYGLIFWTKCERTWPWSKRRANIPRSICQRSKASAPTPIGLQILTLPTQYP